MSGKAIQIPDWVGDQKKAFGFFEDFLNFTSTDLWTAVIDVGGTAVDGDAAGGLLTISGDGTLEDATNVATTNEIFLVAANKPIYLETRIKLSEAATDEMQVVFGVSDLVTVDLMVDGDAGPATSFDGAVIYKVGGTAGSNPTFWHVGSSNAATQTKEATDHLAADETWTTLGIQLMPVNSLDFEITYFIDPTGGTDLRQMRPNAANPRTPDIKHSKLIAGMAEMHAVIGIKNGAAAAEVLNVDYFTAWQKR